MLHSRVKAIGVTIKGAAIVIKSAQNRKNFLSYLEAFYAGSSHKLLSNFKNAISIYKRPYETVTFCHCLKLELTPISVLFVHAKLRSNNMNYAKRIMEDFWLLLYDGQISIFDVKHGVVLL